MLWETWQVAFTRVCLLSAQKSSDSFELQLLRKLECLEHIPWCGVPKSRCVQVIKVLNRTWVLNRSRLLWVPEKLLKTYVVQISLSLADLEKQEYDLEKSINMFSCRWCFPKLSCAKLHLNNVFVRVTF